MGQKFSNWAMRFMQGRYGMDELGRTISMVVIVIFIFSIVFNLAGNWFGRLFTGIATALNTVGLVLLALCFIRVFSRNVEARRAENDRFVKWQTKRASRREYKYLKCKQCGQEMRVPRGKGKIAVKCPKCGEKTEIKS